MVDVVYTVGLKVDCNHLNIKLIQSYLEILTAISKSVPTAGRKSSVIYT
jgi:hypothetical protein